MSARPWRMVASSQPNKSAMYLQPPCPSFSASTAAYLRRSFSDKDWYSIRIWCSMCAEYMVYLPDRKQTRSAPDTFQRQTATRTREVILRLPRGGEGQAARHLAGLPVRQRAAQRPGIA